MYYEVNEDIKTAFNHEVAAFSFENSQHKMAHDIAFFEEWLKQGFHSKMEYLEKSMAPRLNHNLILKDAKSVFLVLFPYAYGKNVRPRLGHHLPPRQVKKGSLIEKQLISKYVFGKNYHTVIKRHLEKTVVKLKEITPLLAKTPC